MKGELTNNSNALRISYWSRVISLNCRRDQKGEEDQRCSREGRKGREETNPNDERTLSLRLVEPDLRKFPNGTPELVGSSVDHVARPDQRG